MKSIRLLTLCLFAVTALITPAKAATFGPVPDGFQIVPTPMTVTIESFLGLQLGIPWDGSVRIGISDNHTFTFNVPVPTILFSYVNIDITEPQPLSLNDNLRLTDIAALALGGPNDLIGTGFDPNNPQVVPASAEVFIGNASGANYICDVNLVTTLGNLASLLPGYDLSGFSGDPNGLVYVSQATMPLWDAIPVPEPSSGLLVSLFGLALLAQARRRGVIARRMSTTKTGPNN